MRQLIYLILVLLISTWLGLKVAQDPGFAMFSYHHWSIEMPLWLALVGFLLFFALVYFVIHLSNSIDSTFYRWKNWLRGRRKDKSYTKTNRGLIELIEGNWKQAEKYLLDGIGQSSAPLINYLAAAKATHEQHAFDRRDEYLRKAHNYAPHAEVVIGITQAQLQLSQHQTEQALATLNHLREIAPRHQHVLKLLERLYVHEGDWQALLLLLPQLRKAKMIDSDNAINFEKHIYQQIFASEKFKQDRLAANELWNNLPKKLKEDPLIILHYQQGNNQDPQSESVVAKAIKRAWNEPLVHLYGKIVGPNANQQLQTAESWLKLQPNNGILFLTLGRLCMRCQLWGKARSYYENSLRLQPTAECYIEYGKLLEVLGDSAAALKNYRDGLLCFAGDKTANFASSNALNSKMQENN